MQRHIVIVCGYGCHLKPELQEYLNRVVEFLNSIPSDVELDFIPSGGATQQFTAPGVTEAELIMTEVIHSPNLKRFPTNIFPEKSAFTTYGNISESAWKIRWYDGPRRPFESTKVTIFCEATRSANVMMLARHFLTTTAGRIENIKLETASWELADPFKQVRNLIYNKLALRFPYLARREQNRRMRLAKYK